MIEILILLSEQEQDTFSFTTLAAALLCIRSGGDRACSVRLRQFAVRHQIAGPTGTLYTTGNNVPLNRMTARYLPKLLTGRKKINVERATSTLRRISNRKLRV